MNREKVIIPPTKPYLTLLGEGRTRTIIMWHDTAASAGTLMSASVTVESDHFIARDISFRVSVQTDALGDSQTPFYLLLCNKIFHPSTAFSDLNEVADAST